MSITNLLISQRKETRRTTQTRSSEESRRTTSKYHREKGIGPDELTDEESEQFLVYPVANGQD
ncbi:hypothetical protein [Bacillus sp. AFS051223]|uniref:hypothetical protein n=1 Tax=Bacillus sp. AFS051223 TaxID=2034280 RepID=UPI00115645A3|nr:hypothetical protein [Bacillus sp. AFS051223]